MRLHENEEDFRDLCSITAGSARYLLEDYLIINLCKFTIYLVWTEDKVNWKIKFQSIHPKTGT